MTKDNVQRLSYVAKVMMEDMFKVRKGETVAITADDGSDKIIVEAMAEAAKNAGGKPLTLWFNSARGDGQVGMPDWPSKALTAALNEVEVWIEMQSVIILYSDIWETAMRENKKLRYLILGTTGLDAMERVFTGFKIPKLGSLLRQVMDMSMKCSVVRVTSENGTDVSYQTNANYAFDIDDGDYSQAIFGTAPGYVNIVPKTGTMNGRIVFDNLMNADVYNTSNRVEFEMKDGKINDVIGGDEAEKFKTYLSSFDDPNMYKISHHMIGLNPGVRKLSGDIVEDERIWGGVDFGFGHTSPMDMPPKGQVAKSHFDGVVAKTSIYFDDEMIIDNGNVIHPELIKLANELIM